MKTVTIGFIRDDGDIQVLATLNNKDGYISTPMFNSLIKQIREDISIFSNLGEKIEIYDREDTQDYVTLT